MEVINKNNFVPETLEQCKQHYIPPVEKYISCDEFGRSDGMNGSCHWCKEMCPYQFEMCRDESWLKGLIRNKTRKEAIEFIEEYKQKINKS